MQPEGKDQVKAPPEVEERFRGLVRPGEEILSLTESDMTLDGQYGPGAWLMVTTARVAAIDPAHEGGLLDLPLCEIQEVSVEQLYGNAVLQVRLVGRAGDQVTVEALRFSRTLSDPLMQVAEAIEDRLDKPGKGEKAARANGHHRNSDGRCKRCGARVAIGTELCLACMNKGRLMARSFEYIWRYRGLFVSSFLLTITLTFLGLIPQYLTKIMLDGVIAERNLPLLKWVIMAIVGVHGLSAALHAVQIFTMQWLGNRVIVDLRTEVYQQLQRLTLAFYDKRQTGWIMSRVTNDTSFLQHFMVSGIQDVAVQVLTLIGVAGILFAMNWKLALLCLLPTPIVAWATARYSKRMHKVYHRIWRRISGMHAMLGDTIPGIRVVKAFTQEDYEVGRFAARNEEVFDENMRAVRMSSWFFPAMGFTTAIGAMIVWGYGGYWVIAGDGSLTVGTLVAFIGYTWRFYQPIQVLSRLSEQVQGAVTAAERLFEILDTEPEVADKKRGVVLPRIEGRIEFENVSFYYEKGDPVLRDVSVRIAPGEMIGLVGSSGSGKTTMINLIARFYEVTEGRITIDGVDIREIDLECLRDQIGMVLQEPFLFHGTIAENVAYGNPKASFEEIVQAATMANAHGFVMELPDGYDTRIGERGVGLSGGEKQRISIARAILKNPRILILDEATSAVDTETEKLIQQAIERLIEGRTTIAIAHRLSTLQNADRLLVMQDGRVEEEGTHAELLAKPDGVFARLVRMQTEVAQSRAV